MYICKENESRWILLVLDVNDIILISSNLSLLNETKDFLSNNFDIKDMGKPNYVISIEIHLNKSLGILGLSQKSYILIMC